MLDEDREAIETLLEETAKVTNRLYEWTATRLDEYFTMPMYEATRYLTDAFDALVRAGQALTHDHENDEARTTFVRTAARIQETIDYDR